MDRGRAVGRGLARRRRASAICRPRSAAGSATGRCTSRSAPSTTRCPSIGHACGHNIIAASAVGAGLALAPLVDELGITLSVIGTPAEEGGGGKILMLERGAFDGVHAALMVHPTPTEDLYPRVSAVAHMRVQYTGRESHAAIAPELGINAADAFTVAQVAIGLLRQHLRPFDQVHGIITHGGDATNVVPAHTEGTWMARSRTLDELEAAAAPRRRTASRPARWRPARRSTITDVCPPYAHMEHDHDIAELYRANAATIGRPESEDGAATFSTDMGNVSLAMPSIHPCIAIETGGAVNHQPEFAEAAINASADRAVVEGALAMAWTVIDAATGPLRDRAAAARRGEVALAADDDDAVDAVARRRRRRRERRRPSRPAARSAATAQPLRERDPTCTSPSCRSACVRSTCSPAVGSCSRPAAASCAASWPRRWARRRSARAPSAGRESSPASTGCVVEVVVELRAGAPWWWSWPCAPAWSWRNRRCWCRRAAAGTRRRSRRGRSAPRPWLRRRSRPARARRCPPMDDSCHHSARSAPSLALTGSRDRRAGLRCGRVVPARAACASAGPSGSRTPSPRGGRSSPCSAR